MRAIRIEGFGGPEVLRLVEAGAPPEPGWGQVRLRVAASGVNRADCLQRRGLYPAPADAPADVPGLEVSGVVEALGPGVSGWAPGDRAMAVVSGGGYAEAAVLHHRELIPVPPGLTLEEAAAIPEAFMTAWDALVLQGGLRAGQATWIAAVGSGVGTAGLQLALAAGAEVIGSSRTPEKLARCAALGLRHGVLAGEGSASAVRAVCPEGVDVILDLVGGSALEEHLRGLRLGGAILHVGLVGGAKATLPLGALLALRARLIGTVLRSRPLEEKLALAQRFGREVVPLFARGVLRPVVDRVLPAAEAAEAHRVLESNAAFGKVVLAW